MPSASSSAGRLRFPFEAMVHRVGYMVTFALAQSGFWDRVEGV